MKTMNTAELREKVSSLYERMLQTSGLMHDLGRIEGNLARAKELRNISWERELRKELDALQAKKRTREAICSEYHKLKAELDRHTDPKAPGYHGPIFEETEEAQNG